MAKKPTQKSALSSDKSPKEITVALIGLFGIFITALGPFVVEKLCPKPDGAIDIKIKHPPDGGLVNSQEAVTGESRNIPADHKIWVVVYSYSDRVFYPHHQNAETDAKGNWGSPEGDIGASTDYGKDFDVICLLADQDAQQEFMRYAESTESSGMETLPKGATKYHQVKVKRRPQLESAPDDGAVP
jgi:hypothetical protein